MVQKRVIIFFTTSRFTVASLRVTSSPRIDLPLGVIGCPECANIRAEFKIYFPAETRTIQC